MADQLEGVISPPALRSGTRPATVVKCDIVGSTGINAPMDMEGQKAFKDGWTALVTEVARAHSGYVARFEGDGAFITFGYPDANEDAAECAVRMALDLVDAIGRATFVSGTRLRVRVGIATGTVGVDEQRDHPMSEALFGTTIDLAERLRAAAEPDQVVISDVTKRLAGRFFHYYDLGRMKLKGFGDPIVAWRVVRASTIASRFEAQRTPGLPIVGRDIEMAELVNAWSHVLAGKGMAICLHAGPGYGKSRLAHAILDRAASDGAVVLEIDCSPSTGNTPLYPIGVLLRRLAGIGRDASPEEARRLAGELLERYLPGEGRNALSYLAPLFGLPASMPPGTRPSELRDRTIAAVVAMLQHLAHDGPVALLCEDLHWADDTTAQAIAQVRAELDALRVLLVVTTRPAEGDHGLPVDLSRFGMIELGKLPDAVAARMVRTMPGTAALDDETVARIVRTAENVPLVIEELTRGALEGGRPEAPAPHQSMPNALALVVHSRLARRPYLKPLVQAASVLGREFSVRLLEQMVPKDLSANLPETLPVLMKDGLLAPTEAADDDRLQFKHALIREAVYESLMPRHRQQLHERAAEMLLREPPGTPDAAPDLIASHYELAGKFEASILMRIAAVDEMASRGAYVEAEGHCKAGLALLDKVADANQRRVLHMRLRLRLGVAFDARYGYSSREAEAQFRLAQDLCSADDDVEFRYGIARGLTACEIVRGNLPAAFALSQRSIAIAEESGRPEYRIDALSVHCYAAMYYRSVPEAKSCIDECLALYEREHGERLTYPVPNDAGTAALAIQPTVEWLRGDAGACEDAIAKCLVHAEKTLDRDFDRAYVHGWIAGVRCTQRRFPEALQHAGIAADIGTRRMYREWEYIGKLLQLVALASMQPSEELLSNALRICAGFKEEGLLLNASWYLWGIARGYRNLGRRDMAAALVAQAFMVAAASGETRMNPELLMLQSELADDPAHARSFLRDALALARDQGAVANELRAAAMLAALDERAGASALAASTLEFLDGRLPYPPGDWMRERRDALRAAAA